MPLDTSRSLAAVADVEAMMYRPLADDEQARVTRWLRYASNIVRSKVPHLDQRIADALIPEPLVTDVVASMVVRALRNPEGVKQETTGPFGVTYDDRVAAGRVYLTDDELATLTPAAAGRRRIGTIHVRACL